MLSSKKLKHYFDACVVSDVENMLDSHATEFCKRNNITDVRYKKIVVRLFKQDLESRWG